MSYKNIIHLAYIHRPSDRFIKVHLTGKIEVVVMRMDVTARVRELMDARGWTIYRVAKEADIPWSTVRNMFKRNTEPSVATLESICNGMGITLAQFFDLEGPNSLTDRQQLLVSKWSLLSEKDQALVLNLIESLGEK